MAYATTAQWAKRKGFASFAAYTAAYGSPYTETQIEEMLEEGAEIINENIGTLGTDITDPTYTSRLEKLNLRMVNRMIQVHYGETTSTPYFSPTDYLQARERRFLQEIGIIKEKRISFFVR